MDALPLRAGALRLSCEKATDFAISGFFSWSALGERGEGKEFRLLSSIFILKHLQQYGGRSKEASAVSHFEAENITACFGWDA